MLDVEAVHSGRTDEVEEKPADDRADDAENDVQQRSFTAVVTILLAM